MQVKIVALKKYSQKALLIERFAHNKHDLIFYYLTVGTQYSKF
jgi:hypothetical protein